ncbi:MAG TPA: peptidylprolyl isomerase [Cyclobacteriaceae bacterium]|nr:peptidylprolyl isomerase [Cyclobacteriaceae bacterium]
MLRYFVILLFLFAACQQKEESFFSQQEIEIFNLQDRRKADSLLHFLKSADVALRLQATIAFGSVQDTNYVQFLFPLLQDEFAEVRHAAAFAIGQTGGAAVPKKLMDLWQKTTELELRNNLLEAIGKTADASAIAWLENLELNKEIATAYCHALYHVGLQRKANDALITKALGLLNLQIDDEARLALAHFFARGVNTDLRNYAAQLSKTIVNEPNPEVLMALLLTMRRVPADVAIPTIDQVFTSTQDYRVKVNACRALGAIPLELTESFYLTALENEHHQVRLAAAESIRLTQSHDISKLVHVATQLSDHRVKAQLYQQIIFLHQHEDLLAEALQVFNQSTDDYVKSFYADCIVHTEDGINLLKTSVLNNEAKAVLRSTAIQILCRQDADNRLNESRERRLDFYRQAVNTGDLAIIGSISSALVNPRLPYKELISNTSFLHEAKAKLNLPRDNEALQELEKAIAYFENRDLPQVVNAYNNPIDWELLQSLNDESKARIKTSKGDIIIQLLSKESPGSAANFVRLAQQGYYKQKYFHRVVPNFVIQGGCYRGDGWGSEDYSIRSEFSPRRYKTGSVGMASAGKDTEGTQWFITHSPTPHLDGRYTIFAEVIDGMQVVHQIQVGDKITDVEIF